MTYEEWAATNPPSAIVGKGHGSDHLWHLEWTSPSRTTYYKCARCYENFGHHYPSMPGIFQAMLKDGVPAKCPRKPMHPIRPKYAASQPEASRPESEQGEAP